MRAAGHLQRDGCQLAHFNTNQEFDPHPSPLKYVENSRNNAWPENWEAVEQVKMNNLSSYLSRIWMFCVGVMLAESGLKPGLLSSATFVDVFWPTGTVTTTQINVLLFVFLRKDDRKFCFASQKKSAAWLCNQVCLFGETQFMSVLYFTSYYWHWKICSVD